MTDLFLIPGYRYCGPGNELKGQKPRNSLDNYCRIHDEAYDKFEKTPYLEYVDGDRDLNRTIAREYTWDNLKRGKYSAGETLTAKFVQGVFKAKEFLAPHNLSMFSTPEANKRFREEPSAPPLNLKSARNDSEVPMEIGDQQNATNTYAQCSAAARGSGAPLGVTTDVALRTKPTIRWGLEDYSTPVIGKSNSQTKLYSVREPFRFNIKSAQAKRNLCFFSVRHSAISKPALYTATSTSTYPDLNNYKTLLPGYNTTSTADFPIKNCGFDYNANNVPVNSHHWDTFSQLNLCELENASFNLMANRKITQMPETLDLGSLTLEKLYKEDNSRTYPFIAMNTVNRGASAPQFVNTDNKHFSASVPCPTEDKIITNLGRGSVKFLMYNSSDTPAVVTIIKYKAQSIKTPILINGFEIDADSPGPGSNIVKQLLDRKSLSLEQIALDQKFSSSGRKDAPIDIVLRPKCRALPENTKFKSNQAVIPIEATGNLPSIFDSRLHNIPFKEVDRIALTIPAGQRQTTICQLPPVSYDSAKDLNRTPYVADMSAGTSGSFVNTNFFGIPPLFDVSPIDDFIDGAVDDVVGVVDDIVDDMIDAPGLIDLIDDSDSNEPLPSPPVIIVPPSNVPVEAPGNAINVQGGGWSSQHGYTFAILVNGMPLMSESGAATIGSGRIVDIQEAPTEVYVEGVYSETVLPSVNRHSIARTASDNSGLMDIAGVKAIRIIPMSEAVRTSSGPTLSFTGATV